MGDHFPTPFSAIILTFSYSKMNTTLNTLTKNPRVDVRKRNLDFFKQLPIIKSRDELKKFE